MNKNEHDQEPSELKLPPAPSRPDLFGMLLRIAVPIGLLAVGVVAFLWLAKPVEKAQTPPVEKKPIRTRVSTLQRQDYTVVVETNGIVQAHNEVALSAQVGGQVTRVSPAFEVGTYFSKGDMLVELDERDYQTAVAVAEAAKLGAEAAVELATETYERNLNLYNKKGVSQALLKQSFAEKAQALAQLNTAQAQLEKAQRDLTRTKILAPFDGRVRQKSVGLGQSVGAGTALGVIFAVDYAEVRLPISGSEREFLDLPERNGDASVEVELRDAINPDSKTVWRARILRTEGTLDADSLELFAIAQIDDPFSRRTDDPPLRIGQPVIAMISGKTLDNVVAIPRMAVRQLDQVFFVTGGELFNKTYHFSI